MVIVSSRPYSARVMTVLAFVGILCLSVLPALQAADTAIKTAAGDGGSGYGSGSGGFGGGGGGSGFGGIGGGGGGGDGRSDGIGGSGGDNIHISGGAGGTVAGGGGIGAGYGVGGSGGSVGGTALNGQDGPAGGGGVGLVLYRFAKVDVTTTGSITGGSGGNTGNDLGSSTSAGNGGAGLFMVGANSQYSIEGTEDGGILNNEGTIPAAVAAMAVMPGLSTNMTAIPAGTPDPPQPALQPTTRSSTMS